MPQPQDPRFSPPHERFAFSESLREEIECFRRTDVDSEFRPLAIQALVDLAMREPRPARALCHLFFQLALGNELDRAFVGYHLCSFVRQQTWSELGDAEIAALMRTAMATFVEIPRELAGKLVFQCFGDNARQPGRRLLRRFLAYCPGTPVICAARWLVSHPRHIRRTRGSDNKKSRKLDWGARFLYHVAGAPPPFFPEAERLRLVAWLKRTFWTGRTPTVSELTPRAAAAVAKLRREFCVPGDFLLKIAQRHKRAAEVLFEEIESGRLDENDPVASPEFQAGLLPLASEDRLERGLATWAERVPIRDVARAVWDAYSDEHRARTVLAEVLGARSLTSRLDQMWQSRTVERFEAPHPRLVVIGRPVEIAGLARRYRVIPPDELGPWFDRMFLGRSEPGRYVIAYAPSGDEFPPVSLRRALHRHLSSDTVVVAFDLPWRMAPTRLNLEEHERREWLRRIAGQIVSPATELMQWIERRGRRES